METDVTVDHYLSLSVLQEIKNAISSSSSPDSHQNEIVITPNSFPLMNTSLRKKK
jgi:hypothetical protein